VTVIITLPLPPSTNRLWPGRRRVYRSRAYLTWIKEAGWTLQMQKPTPFPVGSAIAVIIRAGKAKRARDIDNIGKALLDLLQAHRIVANDRDVADLRLAWDDGIPAGRVQVEAWAIERAAA
jgi:Holliday junction resolvase RusA-like endonuclease